jgi:hypothetical protein
MGGKNLMRQKINRWQFIFVISLLLVALTLAFCGCWLDRSGTGTDCSEAPNIGDHFYTTNLVERNHAIAHCYIDDGAPIACYILKEKGLFSPSADAVPFFRLYNPGNGDHLYTTSEAERANILNPSIGYIDDGYCSIYEGGEPGVCVSIAGYIFPPNPGVGARPPAGTVPFYRLYNPVTGDHFYTISYPERTNALTIGYQDDQYCHIYEGRPETCESIAGYVYPNPKDGTVPLFRVYHP